MKDYKRDEEVQYLMDYEYTYHFFFNPGLFDTLVHYQDLIKETETFLDAQLDDLKNGEEISVIDERFGKQLQYEYIFPEILWKSVFLNLYFLVENSLDKICNNLRNINQHTISLKDMTGNGIYRSSLYLKRVCEINDSFNTASWNSIQDFNKIRNVLVHSDGLFSTSNTKIIAICEKYQDLEYLDFEEGSNKIYVNQNFSEVVLKKVHDFFNQLHVEMNLKKASR